MKPSGKTNLIAVVIVLAAVYGIWWIFTFVQVYLDNIDARDAVVSAYNESGRSGDEGVRLKILGKMNAPTLGWHEEDDGFGTIKRVDGIGVKVEDILVERDEVRKTVKITLQYQRKVLLKPTSKWKFVKFKVVKEGPVPTN